MYKVFLVILLAVSLPSLGYSQISLDFSHERGFYETSFELEIASTTETATIRYTLDGEEPSPSQGGLYDGGIPINSTTVLRVIAYEEGADTTEVITHSFLFLEDVIHQPKLIDQWPTNIYSTGNGGEAQHDYEMDPAIVNSPEYNQDLIRGLKEIPSLSIVMPRSDFWEMYDGQAEKKTSIELLYFEDDERNEQVDCGIEPHSHNRLKRSMRLSFKREYGKGKWSSNIFRHAIIGGESATDEFDRIVLRGGNNRAWSRSWNQDRTAFTRDEWFRHSQIAASGLGSHGTFVHLYVNGLYWGLYNPVERPDEHFTSAYLGGEKEDWFSVSHGGNQGGEAGRFQYLMDDIVESDLSVSSNYEELKDYLNVSDFADYLIVSWMTGVQDWPQNNWWGGIRNSPAGSFKYFGWDNEWSWDVTKNANNGAWVHPAFRKNKTDGPNAALLFNKAKSNSDFMMAFADRVYKLCYNDGAMTDERSRNRWSILNDFIRNAVVAESARWGNSLDDGITRTRNEHWQDEVDRLDGLMNGNVQRFMDALKEEEYYPVIDPPLYFLEGATLELQELAVENSAVINLINPNTGGETYYTIDGTDPRLSGGAISSSAIQSENAELTVANAVEIQARVKNGNEWSALHCLRVFVKDDFSDVKLTEIMYNPIEIEGVDGTELEFLEIKNTSTDRAIDISGATFSDGIDFTFPTGSIIGPQEFMVLASNAEAFQEKCSDASVFGEYDGQLSNGGEKIVLDDPEGSPIISVEYEDRDPWPHEADGGGHSLVSRMTNPEGEQDDSDKWKLSADATCGSPGEDEESIPSRVFESDHSEQVAIYPNPSSIYEILMVKAHRPIISVKLFNALGALVFEKSNANNAKDLSIRAPKTTGIYAISIQFQSGEKETKMLIIR